MKNLTKLTGTAAVALLAGSVAASAALIDFTDNSTGFSGAIGNGITWELTGTPLPPNTDEVGGGRPLGGLAWENDGVGIGNDEVTQGTQSLTLTFSEEVTMTSALYLDLFAIADHESAIISVGSAPGAVADETFATAGSVGGFATTGSLSLTGTSFTFFAGSGFDDGDGDFALAGVNIAPVPLPAGILLMGTALGGLGLARRRKQKASA